ncbi:DUF1275 family protein [Pseudomonas tohonis]|uniref:DUF1275 family protein n=1 Tax=Pseudomonas tohonis TaxID=2725477 RepID=A0A6J4DYE3_9PSED|nr:YoaK family protein [Pseudomonas tohonis]BCG22115.1 DUF1275 family protein [Pseudomonas tohonis]
MLPSIYARSNPKREKLRKVRARVGMGMVAALSVLAGMTDAIGLMALGDFVSFMSGNTTRLAVAISSGDVIAGGRLVIAVLSFVGGNALGVVLAHFAGRRSTFLLALVSILLAISALLPEGARIIALIGATTAMGMLNAVVEQVNGMPIGLTYVTGALSRFGRGLGRWLLGRRHNGWRVQLVPWSGMLVGAIIGACLGSKLGLPAMLFSALSACLLTVASLFVPASWQRGYKLG